MITFQFCVSINGGGGDARRTHKTISIDYKRIIMLNKSLLSYDVLYCLGLNDLIVSSFAREKKTAKKIIDNILVVTY